MALEIDFKKDFPQLTRTVHEQPLAYLDNAATTLKPKAVVEVISNHYALETSNVHRGVHWLSENATLAYESARMTIKDFLHAQDPGEIVFTSGTTASINMIAQMLAPSFKPGDEILLTEMEHHSNIIPWQMLAEKTGALIKYLPLKETGELCLDQLPSLLTPKTRVLSLTYISNAIGTINPVKDIVAQAKECGVLTVVDGAQAVSHVPIDVTDLGCDFFVFSGHKLFGPTGIGVLYGKASLLASLPPAMGGGGMIREVTMTKSTYAPPPEKFEAGTPHIAGAIGLAAAIRYVQAIGFAFIEAKEKELTDYARQALKGLSGLTLIGEAQKHTAIFSFVLEGIHPHDIGTLLDQKGIAIRAGHHCCQPLMKFYDVVATTRASLAFYNTKEDIDALIEGIQSTQEVFS